MIALGSAPGTHACYPPNPGEAIAHAKRSWWMGELRVLYIAGSGRCGYGEPHRVVPVLGRGAAAHVAADPPAPADVVALQRAYLRIRPWQLARAIRDDERRAARHIRLCPLR